MNALGLILLGSITHATGFAVLGVLVYLVFRRRGPAAGSLAAGSSLLIMVLVSMVVLSPWPRWWTVAPESFATTSAGVLRAAEPIERSPAAEQGSEPLVGRLSDTSKDSRPQAPRDADVPRPTLLAFLLEELRRPTLERASSRWGWLEWLAVGFFISVALGLVRLGLGLWSMMRLRARSVPIDDRELHDAIEILRAELSCTRPVEVRELAELATPATIGWRRPLLFLPRDWRDWSSDERRAVLAHELATRRRGDFLAGLAAQVGLALHFYHPLAHWLASRLRLEQELAADAWGGPTLGGQADVSRDPGQDGLAPRQPRHDLAGPCISPVTWHLCSEDRDASQFETDPSGFPLGGDPVVDGRPPLGAGPPGCRSARAGWRVAGPGSESADRPARWWWAQDALHEYNLNFLPVDTKMVLAIQPASLLHRRDVHSIVSSILRGSQLRSVLVLPPEDIDQFLLFWEGDPQPAGGPQVLGQIPSGFVLRMSKPQDWKAHLAQVHGPSVEVRHAGQTYLRSDNAPLPGAFFTPDDRTLVHTHNEELLRELLEDRNAPAPHRSWDEAWKKVAKGQVMMGLETRWIRRRVAHIQQNGRPGPRTPQETLVSHVQSFSPLWENARSYALGINGNDKGLTVDLVAGTGSDQDAKPVAETIQAMVILGKNALHGLPQDLRQPVSGGEGMEWLLKAAGSLLEKAGVETSEGFVHLSAHSSVDLAEGIKVLVPVVTTAQASSRRFQSVNNLKQIGLAFYNYRDANNRFPAAVNFGGKSGKVPYSWRVAILPYIEQQALYNAYNFDEPWDGPNNRRLIEKMPAIYGYPGAEGTLAIPGYSAYFVFTGPSTALSVGPPGGAAGRAGGMSAAIGATGQPHQPNAGPPKGAGDRLNTPPLQPVDAPVSDEPGVRQITDGTSNTILAVESRRDIPWTKPEDIPFDSKVQLPNVGEFSEDGFNALFADGSVRFVKKSIQPQVLKALITRDGGEVISSDSY